MSARRSVRLVTLGCARNEVDSEEMAGRLDAAGWETAGEGEQADVVVVNTCGFVESAKKDSIDTLLAASDTGAKVVAVGCLAERYGKDLAEQLPEADAVLGFDSYGDLSTHLQSVLDGAPGAQPHARRPPPAAADQPGRARAGPGGAGAGRRLRRHPRPRRRPDRAAQAPRRRPGRAAQARLRLRPPLLVLRHPELPRRLRLAPAVRRPGRGPLARRARRAGAGPGQRELARRTARTSATCGCSRRCCPSSRRSSRGSGCPTCSRPRCGRRWSTC